MSAPTLINLPPPPSDPVTPSEAGPGTPNSTTTSMSELSTVAIKDGHRGHPHHHHTHDKMSPLTNLDTERADRISRLPGLERLANLRQPSNSSLPAGASASNPQGYFEAPVPALHTKERSTVGSASATGSVGGRTTWASLSDAADTATDKMSEDLETSSVGAMSDEGNASLVGFGEGASSTVSGPVSSVAPLSGATSGQNYSYNSKVAAASRAANDKLFDSVDGTPPAANIGRSLDDQDMDDVGMGEPADVNSNRHRQG